MTVLTSRSLVSAVLAIAFVFSSGAHAQAPASAQPPQTIMALSQRQASGIALSPAVVVGRGKLGQSLSQTLTLTNNTNQDFPFEMVANDVIVRGGSRVFVPAGNLQNGIAQSAVFSPQSGVVKPGTSQSVEVRLTLPAETPVRAVVAIFHGLTPKAPDKGNVAMTASLGCLITFNLTDDVKVEAEAVRVKNDAGTVSIEETLTNTGAEPAIVNGVAAILTSDGKLAGKVPFEQQRLLPAEKLKFTADYAAPLQPGSYRVLCSFEFEGKQLTNSGTLRVE